MNVNEVIKYPILTEKTYKQMETNVYTFAVDKRTNKTEVKKTVEFIFDVKVLKVNIIKINRKPKKVGKYNGFVAGYKKAIVKLDANSTINIFPDDEPTKEEKAKVTKKPAAKKEMSETEKKVAAKLEAKKAPKTEVKKETKVEVKKETKVEVKKEAPKAATKKEETK